MAVRPAVTYTPYAISSKGTNCDIITLAQFKEGNSSSETSDNAESGEEYYDDSIMPPLIRE